MVSWCSKDNVIHVLGLNNHEICIEHLRSVSSRMVPKEFCNDPFISLLKLVLMVLFLDQLSPFCQSIFIDHIYQASGVH